MPIKLILMIFALLNLSSSPDYSVLSKGATGIQQNSQNLLIRDENQINKIWGVLGIKEKIPRIDFDKEIVFLIIQPANKGNDIDISKVENKEENVVQIGYRISFNKEGPDKEETRSSHYLIAKLDHPGAKNVKIEFFEDAPTSAVPADVGMGQVPEYSIVLKGFEGMGLSDYFAIDKGNVWTYRIESGKDVKEETHSIISLTDGWSIFDDFFGKKNVGMRIDPEGGLLVSTNEEVRTFYTPDVQKSFEKTEFKTPAGKFDDLLIITIPENDVFWFKDVYAKGVGLIYHEHKYPKGSAKYSLIRANIRGKKFPSK
jgi:hypothetical protein